MRYMLALVGALFLGAVAYSAEPVRLKPDTTVEVRLRADTTPAPSFTTAQRKF